MPQVKKLKTVMVQLHPTSLLVITSVKSRSPALPSSCVRVVSEEFFQRKTRFPAGHTAPSPDWFHKKKKKCVSHRHTHHSKS